MVKLILRCKLTKVDNGVTVSLTIHSSLKFELYSIMQENVLKGDGLLEGLFAPDS